jgi:hypothetical protein
MESSNGTQPGDNGPPIIPPLLSPPPPAKEAGHGVRQLLCIVANICFWFFLADAAVSLIDDTLALVANVHVILGIRSIVNTFAVLIGLVVYLLLGVTPALPKRFLLPITLFNPAMVLISLLAWIYFPDRIQLFSWGVSFLQVNVGVLLIVLIHGGFRLGCQVIPGRLIGGKLFRWQNLAAFCAVNIFLVLPGATGYVAFCGTRAVDHFTDGFVTLRPSGFTVQVRKYVRNDGKSILLVPMSHIGEPDFYHSLSESFPTNSTILMEGVKDDKNLLTNRITYKRMATSLGLSQQQKEFKPSPVQMVPADIDVDQFAPSTIDFLNLVMLIHSRGLNAQNLLLLMQSSGSIEFEKQVFDDILRKRNHHLLQEIRDQLSSSDQLVVPWGAAHMPEIAREIQKAGFRLDSSREYVAIRFRRRRHQESEGAAHARQQLTE